MLTITKTYTNTETDAQLQEVQEFTTYKTTGTVQLAGDSIWGYDGSNTVEVDNVQVIKTTYTDDNTTSIMVNAEHNATWDIYTDSGFESAISKVVGFEVSFTEQGMQDDGYASLEA